MNTDGMKKFDRLFYIIRLFQVPGRRYRTREIADKLGEGWRDQHPRMVMATGIVRATTPLVG